MGVTINKKSTQQDHRLRTDSSLSHRGGGGGLNAFYWYQIFALDSAVVEVQEMFSSHGGHLTNAMHHHGVTLIKSTHHDETKKRAHDSQIVRAKEYLKLSHGGSSYKACAFFLYILPGSCFQALSAGVHCTLWAAG